MSFDSIPVLNLSLARSPDSKPAFLADLRHALLEVGFLYISHTGIDDSLIQAVIRDGKAFFHLPQDAKLAVQMKNEKSFLGYNLLGGEVTAHRTDWREQIDLSTPHPVPAPNAPLYHNLLAPNQWPSADLLPSFRPTYERYIGAMSALSTHFTSLIAEALGLAPTAFDRFFDADQQHKLKIVRYPDLDELGLPPPASKEEEEQQAQGVGPHKDSMLTSYLLQASAHRGLQAQNVRGEWIDCPPREGTLVVAIGQGLEALTQGVCASTTHRVLSPARGSGARYSVPFFQGVSYDATFESIEMPETVRRLKAEIVAKAEGEGGGEGAGQRRDDVEFTFVKGRWKHLGEATFYNRCKSHGDVAQRWYPEVWKLVCEEREREQMKEKEKEKEKEQMKGNEKEKGAEGQEQEREEGNSARMGHGVPALAPNGTTIQV